MVAGELAGPALNRHGVFTIDELGPVASPLVIKEVWVGDGSWCKRGLDDRFDSTITYLNAKLVNKVRLLDGGRTFLKWGRSHAHELSSCTQLKHLIINQEVVGFVDQV